MEYRCVGKNLLRIDGVDKVTGHALYGADVQLPGRLEAKVLRSPLPHAKILSIDTSRAERLPGVKAVLTPYNIKILRIGRFFQDRTVIAWEKVRYCGEPVAAVAAVDADTAEEAVSLINVEYEELPAVFDPMEAVQEGAPLVHEDIANYKQGPVPLNRSGNVLNQVKLHRGDTGVGFDQSDVVYEDTYRTQVQSHAFIQTHEAVARVDNQGRVTIWTSNNGVFPTRAQVAEAMQLPLSKVRVIGVTVGGHFGGKGAALVEPICAMLALKAGVPVRLAMTREEEFIGTYMRHASTIQLKLGAKKDGTLLALQGRALFDSGAYSDTPGAMSSACANLLGVYRIPNIDLSSRTVYTNNSPSGMVRAPGGPQTTFAIESHIDMITAKLGLDPLEIRLRNGVVDGDLSPSGRGTLKNVGLKDTLSEVTGQWKSGKATTSKYRGQGIACNPWHANAFPGEEGAATSAYVKVNEDGTIVLSTGVAEVGAGQHSILSQIVAEELGVSYDSVSVVAADTDATPYEMSVGGSRSTARVGNTVKLAAQDAREQVLKVAAEKLEANADDLEIQEGRIFVKGTPGKSIPFATIAGAAMSSPNGPILGTGLRLREERAPLLQQAKGTVDAPSYSTHLADVEVDLETGRVDILYYVAVHDVGLAISPIYVEGQIEGAVTFGLGFGLMEDIPSGKGRNLATSFHEYKMLTALDVPKIDPGLVQIPSDFGPYGAKPIGEPPTAPVAAAIANAIYDAIGIRITELPITPERVVAALRDRVT